MNYTQIRAFLRTTIVPWLLKVLLLLFWVNPESLYGRQVRTSTVIVLSVIVAWIASVTNLLNSLGVFPILTATFRSWGFLGFLLAVLFAVLLNVLQNHLTSLLVRRGEFKRLASAGLSGLISVQVFLTSCSTVGGQLMNSQVALGHDHGSTILVKTQADFSEAKERFMKSALYLETKQNCDEGRARMDAPPPPAERDRVILETVGSWAERERLGVSASPESFCGQWERLQKETQEKYRKLDLQIEEALSQGLPPVKVVEKVLPDQYQTEFTDRGTIADGNTELAVALSRTARLLGQGRISELGTSLLLSVLSKVTSIILILVLIAYSKHPAVILSFSPKAGLIKQRYLQ